MKFKIGKTHNSGNILDPGYLTNLATQVMNEFKLKAGEKLTDTQMAQIPSMFARLDPNFDVREVDSDAKYLTSEGKPFLGRDLKAIIALMYNKPRTAFWQPARAQIHDTSFCAGVPLPMLGFKRFRNIAYNDFRLHSSCFDDSQVLKEDCIEKLWKLDQLLGFSLASTHINEEGDIETNGLYGLGMLCALPIDFEMTGKVIRLLREHGLGNRRGTYASAYGASNVPLNRLEEENLTDTEKAFVTLYNNSNSAIKHLLIQRWAWFGNHRNSDMICDFRNWDNMPVNLDKGFDGLQPKVVVKNANNSLGVYGL